MYISICCFSNTYNHNHNHKTKEQLETLRANGDLVFQQLPLLEIDGLKLIQSGAIVRYLARKYNMYGKSATDQAHCDMLGDGIKDILGKIAGYPFQADKEAWKTEVKPLLPRYLNAFTSYLSQNNNKEMKGYLLGDTITFVDITLFDVLERLTEIFPNILEEYPFVKSFHARMLSRDNIKKYYTSGATLLTGDEYVKKVRAVLN